MEKKLFLIIVGILLFAVSVCYGLNPQWTTEIQISPANPQPGDTITFSATMHQAGGGTISNLYVIGIVDGPKVFEHTYPLVTSGEVTVVTFTWIAVPGKHTVYMKIDPDQTSSDTNQTSASNLRSAAFTVPGPNLELKDVMHKPLSHKNGDSVTFSWKVTNNTTYPSSHGWVYVYVNGKLVDQLYYPILAAPVDPSQPQSYTWTVTCGQTVAIIVDATKSTVETNEKDNHWQKKMNCYQIKKVEPEGVRKVEGIKKVR